MSAVDSSPLLAAELFHVRGLVAVITGGGTGEIDYHQPASSDLSTSTLTGYLAKALA